jgi:hypothetical protein
LTKLYSSVDKRRSTEEQQRQIVERKDEKIKEKEFKVW